MLCDHWNYLACAPKGLVVFSRYRYKRLHPR